MSDIMKLNGRELIELLSLAFGPSGCEDEVRELIKPRAEKIADRAYVLEIGRMVKTGTGKDLLADDDIQKAYLGG